MPGSRRLGENGKNGSTAKGAHMGAKSRLVRGLLAVWSLLGSTLVLPSAAEAAAPVPTAPDDLQPPSRDILTPQQWKRVDLGVDRALVWIASRQQPDGSFPTKSTGQPAVTALCVLAFLSRGHLPGEGPHEAAISKAIDYVLSCQHPEGLIALVHPRGVRDIRVSQAAAYNHAIGALLLSEVYGMTAARANERIRSAAEAALAYTQKRYPQPKRRSGDQGGWRYWRRFQSSDSDLSVTSWNLMFLRSCQNAGFDVHTHYIDEALEYVRRCFNPQRRTFFYALRGKERVTTRAMTGAGVLSLSLGGQHQTSIAREAGGWILRHPFDRYRVKVPPKSGDRFFYGAFYCSQAMFQLGGRYWAEFYPVMAKTLLNHQRRDGSWDPELRTDNVFGNVYSSAMAVLALSPPYQLLPIFQR